MRGKNTQTLWFQIFRKKMLETTHWFKSWGKGTMHLWLQLLKKETFRHHSQIFLHNGEKTHQCIICDMKQHFQSVREEKKQTNALLVTTVYPEKNIWNDIMNPFMRERNHTNVHVVVTDVQQKVLWDKTK